MLAVAVPEARLTSLVVSATNGPPALVLHLRSPAGLFVRAGAPGDVFVALHSAVEDLMYSLHAALALMVSVGPVVELNPASKSVAVGAVSIVEVAVICILITRPAVIDAFDATLQLPPFPDAVHCAEARPAANVTTSETAIAKRLIEGRFTLTPVRREKYPTTGCRPG